MAFLVNVKEVTQAGDVFLLKFMCPHCGASAFSGFPLSECTDCRKDLAKHEIELPTGPRSRRLLSGTKRKKYVSKKLIQSMLISQDRRCAYCDRPFDFQFHLEHIIPLAVGGTNEPRNLCPSCPRCNQLAGAKAFSSFQAKKLYILEAA